MTYENFRKAVPIYDNIKALEQTLNNLEIFARNSDSTCTKVIIVFKSSEILELNNLDQAFSKNLIDLIKKFKRQQLETLTNQFNEL